MAKQISNTHIAADMRIVKLKPWQVGLDTVVPSDLFFVDQYRQGSSGEGLGIGRYCEQSMRVDRLILSGLLDAKPFAEDELVLVNHSDRETGTFHCTRALSIARSSVWTR